MIQNRKHHHRILPQPKLFPGKQEEAGGLPVDRRVHSDSQINKQGTRKKFILGRQHGEGCLHDCLCFAFHGLNHAAIMEELYVGTCNVLKARSHSQRSSESTLCILREDESFQTWIQRCPVDYSVHYCLSLHDSNEFKSSFRASCLRRC
jgi:hypothetical protein